MSREEPSAAKAYLRALTEEPYAFEGEDDDDNDNDDGNDSDAVGAAVDEITKTTAGRATRRSTRRTTKAKSDGDSDNDKGKDDNDDSARDDDVDNGEVQLTYPLPPCSSDIVTITRSDILRLWPRQYLNDNIIDYYFKCVSACLELSWGR